MHLKKNRYNNPPYRITTYFVKQPRTENDLNEVVHDKSILKLEWFSVLHKPRADNLYGWKK